MIEHVKSKDGTVGAVTRNTGSTEALKAGGVFAVECFDKDGALKWQAESHNLVVNVGLQSMNAVYFSGTAATATWYIGLYGAAASNNPAAGDTSASHAGWTEVFPYSNATRPTCTFGAATTASPSVISNILSPASFAISATDTIGGAFLISNNTKGGTTGILFSAADFSAPGDRAVVLGDTLNVTYTFSLAG
jgi:hypothetical protein